MELNCKASLIVEGNTLLTQGKNYVLIVENLYKEEFCRKLITGESYFCINDIGRKHFIGTKNSLHKSNSFFHKHFSMIKEVPETELF